MRFKDKVAVITAGASGIGRATAEIMASEGAVVVVIDNHEERLNKTVEAITAAGGEAHGRRVDVTEPKQVEVLVRSTVEQFGKVDILVNAVGGSTVIANPAATIDVLTHQEWRRILDFNLEGTFLFCHALAPIMMAFGAGKIINLSSIAARGLEPGGSCAYATAKAGIVAFTRKLADELGPFGVTVNAIAPGLTLTERTRPIWDSRSEQQQEDTLKLTPLRRMAEAADPARVICFLASGDADFVTGVTIDVTGGR